MVVGSAAYIGYRQMFLPTISSVPEAQMTEPDEVTVLAERLSVPWEVRQLPDGDWLVTERTGNLVRVKQSGEILRVSVPAIAAAGEGGLLGFVLHPDFSNNRWLYLYRTTETDNGRRNQVVRYVYDDAHTLSEQHILLNDIPGAQYHDGGRMEFGPDGYLYIATGDAGRPELAQDTDSLAGKILRMTDTGDVPEDNPYQNYTYSYGHRNPQGIAWDAAGNVWSTEHGRSGLQSGMDEVNLIEAGANYGWPVIEGDESAPSMIVPKLHSGADETWAPASLAITDNTMFFGGLRGQSIYRATIDSDQSVLSLQSYLRGAYGRIRSIRVIDDALLVTTSNTDGRGNARASDDMLIRIPLSSL